MKYVTLFWSSGAGPQEMRIERNKIIGTRVPNPQCICVGLLLESGKEFFLDGASFADINNQLDQFDLNPNKLPMKEEIPF